MTAVAGAGVDAWWLRDWPHRHVIEIVSPDPSGEINTALATLDTAGKCQPDGRDLRVVEAASGMPAKRRVISVEKGTASLKFEVNNPSVLRYHVYYGNPKAEKATDEWGARLGGLTLATYENALKQPPRDLRHMRQLLRYAGKKCGEGKRRAIDDVTNPYEGPNDNYISVYKGKIFCREAGRYLFATNSDDSSFLLINGRLVAHMAGANNPLNDFDAKGGRGGGIQLTRGIHNIEYYHVEWTGDQLARAGWRPPWSKQIKTIPEDVFIRELRTISVAREGRGRPLNTFFTCVEVDAVQFGGVERTFVTMAFKARVSGRFGEPELWRWDFGDGVGGDRPDPKHLYKKEGVYKVRLQCTDKLGYRDECVREVSVKAKSPTRLKALLEISVANAVLSADDDVDLSAKFRCTGPDRWPCVLDVVITTHRGRFLDRIRRQVTLSPRRWAVWHKSLKIRAPRSVIRLSLEYDGVRLAGRTVHVAPPETMSALLNEENGVFVNEKGERVVLRLSSTLGAPKVERLADRLRKRKSIKVCVVDDSLAPIDDGASEVTYYAVMRRLLEKKYPDCRISVTRVGAEYVSHHDPLRRLGRVPRAVAREKPDLVIVAASMRDLTNYVPVSQHETFLYAMADRLRGCTDAEILLVTPPPLIINPSLSKLYAERTVRVALRRGLKVVDVYSAFARLGGKEWQRLFQDPQEPDVLYLYPNVEGQKLIGRRLVSSLLR